MVMARSDGFSETTNWEEKQTGRRVKETGLRTNQESVCRRGKPTWQRLHRLLRGGRMG